MLNAVHIIFSSIIYSANNYECLYISLVKEVGLTKIDKNFLNTIAVFKDDLGLLLYHKLTFGLARLKPSSTVHSNDVSLAVSEASYLGELSVMD